MKTVNIHEAKTHFSQIIQEVSKGNSFIIAKAGKPIGKLIPFSGKGIARTPGGSWEGQVEMSDDFDTLPRDVEDEFYGAEP